LTSLIGLWALVTSPGVNASEAWSLPIKMLTALPWFLAGATASVLLAYLLAGDVRQTKLAARRHDAFVVGSGLGVAAASAQMIQMSLLDFVTPKATPQGALDPLALSYPELISQSAATGLAGFACGMVIGFMVPQACKGNIVTPFYPTMAHALKGLLHRAQLTLGTQAAAANWVFTPHNDLGGITPAEAIQYRTRANGVLRLLESEAPHQEPHSKAVPARFESEGFSDG
jgi:hypothetical protein